MSGYNNDSKDFSQSGFNMNTGWLFFRRKN